jgi:hypothetical protein
MLAVVTWDGGGGDLFWHNPLNWSTDTLPGPSDDVVIPSSGDPAIQFADPSGASIHSLTSGRAFVLSAGTLTSAGDFRQNSPFAITGGAFAGAGNLVLTTPNATWSGGAMTGTGRTQILPGARLIITGDVSLSRILVNNGVLTWASGNITASSAQIYNLIGRVFNAQSQGSLSGPNSTLINTGTLKRNGTSTSTTTIAIAVNSPGITDIIQGTLLLTGPVTQISNHILAGGDWRLSNTSSHLEIPGASITTLSAAASVLLNGPHSTFPALTSLATNLGHLTLAGDRNLDFTPAGGVFDNAAGAMFIRSGLGTTTVSASRFDNHGMLDLQGGIFRPFGGMVGGGTITLEPGTLFLIDGAAATIAGAALSGAGAFQIASWVSWTFGTWSGPGSVSVTATGTLALLSTGTKSLARPTTINGALLWLDGPWKLGGMTVVNSGVATFSLATAQALGTTGVASTFSNSGTLIKTGAGALTFQGAGGGVALNNSGTLAVQQGRLVLSGGGTSGGAFAISSGSDLSFGGLAGTLSNPTISGAGTVTVANATTWTGGTILGPGTMSITPPASLTISAGSTLLGRSLTNNGVLTWTNGAITLSGPVVLTNNAQVNLSAPSALVTSGSGAIFHNPGIITKSGLANTSFFTAQMTFDNTGTVNVTGGDFALNGPLVTQVSSGVLTAGVWNVTNASLRFVNSAITTNRAAVLLSGFSATIPSMQTLSRNEGTLTFDDGCQYAITPAGGTLTNAGPLALGIATYVRIHGDLALDPASHLTVNVGGSIPFSDFGYFQIDGSFIAGGHLTAAFINGYTPDNGAMYNFFQAAGSTGAFAMSDATGLAAAQTIQFDFVSGQGRLTVIPA